MNTQWRKSILSIILVGLTVAAAHAASAGVQVLSDKDMSQIKGGLCGFSICETGVPSGNCQPYPPNLAGLCLMKTCTLHTEELGNTVAVQCILIGKVTCTAPGAYRKCVAGKLWDICWNSDNNVCGTLVEPHCAYSLVDKQCHCSVIDDRETPCDWTNCLLESQ